jgi:hypothetical protein
MALTIGLPPMATPRQNSIRMLPLVEAEVRRRQVKELANLAQPVPRQSRTPSRPIGLPSLGSPHREST